jgi:hypothetical protein
MTARSTPAPSTARATGRRPAAARRAAPRGSGSAAARKKKTPAKKKATKPKGSTGAQPASTTSVTASLDRDLKAIGKLDKALADSSLAAAARVLALELDNATNSATSKSMCARALAETLGQLRALLPADRKDDKVDELSDRRAKRLSGRAKA